MKKMCKKITLLFVALLSIGFYLFAISLVQEVYGQEVSSFDLDIPDIREPQECALETLTGDRAWIPFELRVFYDFNRNAVLTYTQVGKSHPTETKSTQTYFFFTEEKDEYNITLDLKYETPIKRAIKIEYVSAGDLTHTQIIPYENGKFCKKFHVITGNKPVVPTLEEVYGEVVVTMIEEVPNFVPALKASTQNTSTAFLFIALGLGVMVILTMIMMFTFLSRRKQDKKIRTQVLTASNTATASARIVQELAGKIETRVNGIDEKLENRLNQMDISFRTKVVDWGSKIEEEIRKIKIEKEELEEMKYSKDVGIQQRKAEYERKQEELEKIIDVKDTGILRNIMNQLPIENLRMFAKSLKNKTDNSSMLKKKIIFDVFQRRQASGDDIKKLIENDVKMKSDFADIIEMENESEEKFRHDEKTFSQHRSKKTIDDYVRTYKQYSYDEQVNIYTELIRDTEPDEEVRKKIDALNKIFTENKQ